jgi:hypothetical protein
MQDQPAGTENKPIASSEKRPDELHGEFRPVLLSRRGVLIGWGLALLLTATWLFLTFTGREAPAALTFLNAFLYAASASISLGNWMDRRTVIRLDDGGVTFDNGLRHTRLEWQDIRQVQVLPSNWGRKVRVIGSQAYFGFRTLGEVKVQGETKGRMGFVEGEKILRQILKRAGLRKTEQQGTIYYYVRE